MIASYLTDSFQRVFAWGGGGIAAGVGRRNKQTMIMILTASYTFNISFCWLVRDNIESFRAVVVISWTSEFL